MASCVLLAGLSLGLAFGQTTEPPPVFEAADVYVSVPSTNQFPYMRGRLRPGRNDLSTATMVDLIKTAYGVDAENVIGGPNWLELDRFDVIAKAPPAASPETLRLMLQALLADRFGLTTHKENKPLPGYVLTLGKRKLQLKASDGPGEVGCRGQPPPARVPGTVPLQVVTCHNVSMATFAEQVRKMASAYIDHTVVDQTGLDGTWDFTVRWTGRGQLVAAGADGVTIFDAVDKLGLKLEPQQVPSPVIVVDDVNRKPTDNLPNVAQLLPPADNPTEFEVADIKPSAPGSNPGGFRIQPGGRLDVRGMTVKFLITFAWDTVDEMIVGLPKSLESDRFDIIAKTDVSGPPGSGPPIDIDTLRLMLRALLQDRFKLTTHGEVQTVSVYALVAPKRAAKLKKADESSRIRFAPAPGAPAAAANPALTRWWTFQNMTMAQLASKLRMMAGGYIDHPVIDSTGLEGGWDFTLGWSDRGTFDNARRSRNPSQLAGDMAQATDPGGTLSVFEALDKELGLKLELQKHPMPVLVIDHVELKPTDN